MMRVWILTVLAIFIAAPAWAEPVSVQPGKGMVLTSEDEQFQLKLRPRAQVRYTINDKDAEHKLSIRRARLAMTGHMFGKNNYFKMELAFSPRDLGIKNGIPTNSPLLDWYSEFRYFRDATLRVGQYKVPFSRQRVISSGNLQMVDRSLAQGEFNVDRDIGFDIRSKDLLGLNLFRYYVGGYSGFGRDNLDTQSFDRFMALARVEMLPFGMCDDYKEAALKLSEKPCLSLALGAAFLPKAFNNRGIKGSPPEDQGTTAMYIGTSDAMFKWFGTSLFAETYTRYGVRDPGDQGDFEEARNGVGGTVQLGQMVLFAPVEFTARYSFIRNSFNSSLRPIDEAGAGVSWYPGDHSLKVQADCFKTWENLDFNDGSVQGRVQVQVAF